MSAASSGFTLIELALAIIVLGILAAVAIPRFINTSHEARAATITYAARAVATTASAIHLKAMLASIPFDATIRQLDIGGGDMVDIRYGYPACTANGIAKAAGTTKGYVWYMGTDPGACSLYPDVGKNSTGNTIYLNNCGVMYVNGQGTIWTPNTSGC